MKPAATLAVMALTDDQRSLLHASHHARAARSCESRGLAGGDADTSASGYQARANRDWMLAIRSLIA